MKFLVVDTEGTSKDIAISNVIQFAALLEDTNNVLPYEEIPKFIRYIKHPIYHCDSYAAQLNHQIFSILSGETKELEHLICNHFEFVDQFVDFLKQHGFKPDEKNNFYYLTFAGKNLHGYDIPICKKLPKWDKFIKVRNLVLEPSILYIDWGKDEIIPNLSICKQRANLNEMVSHSAPEDAWDVLQLLRPFYKK